MAIILMVTTSRYHAGAVTMPVRAPFLPVERALACGTAFIIKDLA
ncbi:hypothetical protein [Aeromonas bivalvium]|nr:hypothetical protein [Aeromonas bivalvium]